MTGGASRIGRGAKDDPKIAALSHGFFSARAFVDDARLHHKLDVLKELDVGERIAIDRDYIARVQAAKIGICAVVDWRTKDKSRDPKIAALVAT